MLSSKRCEFLGLRSRQKVSSSAIIIERHHHNGPLAIVMMIGSWSSQARSMVSGNLARAELQIIASMGVSSCTYVCTMGAGQRQGSAPGNSSSRNRFAERLNSDVGPWSKHHENPKGRPLGYRSH